MPKPGSEGRSEEAVTFWRWTMHGNYGSWIEGEAPEAYEPAEVEARTFVPATLLAQTEAERDEWREEAWRCYVESGADPDGETDGTRLNLGEAAYAVKELRSDYEEEK